MYLLYKKINFINLLNIINMVKCPKSHVFNKKSRRCVKKDGKIGKKIIRNTLKKSPKSKSPAKPKSNKMKDMKIVFNNFRYSELKKQIIAKGGKVLTSVSNNTSIVVVKKEVN